MRNKTAIALFVLGVLQMAGDLTGWPALKALGAITTASPAPRVFSAVKGYETYSTRFSIEWVEGEKWREFEITPEVYSRMHGAYNRRNVYGAALAYGPVLPPELRDPVMRYALCGQRPLLKELGVAVDEVHEPIRVRFRPREGMIVPPTISLLVNVSCP